MTKYLDWLAVTFLPDDGTSTGPMAFLLVARLLAVTTIIGALLILANCQAPLR